MTKLFFTLYGALAYLLFLGVFLYAVAFVADAPFVPKTLDSGRAGPLLPTLAVNGVLLGLFAAQHSVMARPAFKRWWTRIVPPPIERSTYVLCASLALAVLYVFWRPLPQAIWTFTGVPALFLIGLSLAGWGVVLVSTFLISHFELFGLAQVYDRLRGRVAKPMAFRTPGFYRVIRHPIYAGFILAFWAAPRMSLGHLFFAVATTGYIFIGIWFEERDLVAAFGERYLRYRESVGMMWPKPRPVGRSRTARAP